MHESIHVVGVAGSGMCAVAEASMACGFPVSGSDRYADQATPVPVMDKLKRAGCMLYPQDGSGISEKTSAVIVSTAIEAGNPDIVRAKGLSIPVYHRTEWLARLIGSRPLLGIAGTSGKSTVTAMVGWILAQQGLNPYVVNGAAVSAWESANASGQVRVGSEDLWVLELDESDRSLFRFFPQHAVITNRSADHFPMEETEELFAAFRKQVSGHCLSGPWMVTDYEADLTGCHFTAKGVQYRLQVPGMHNAENALAATALCACIAILPEACAGALETFPGVRRRLERCVPSGDVFVFDDFGHNPAKIAAAIDSLQPFASSLTVVWRPHGYGPLRNMMEDLVTVFRRLSGVGTTGRRHRLLLLPVYDVGGTAQRDVQSGDLAARLKPFGVQTYCLATYAEILGFCDRDMLEAGDAVIVMGARDPGLSDLARLIAQLHQKRINTGNS
jgi:UDP-N-acetylmuramate--alanine ligase